MPAEGIWVQLARVGPIFRFHLLVLAGGLTLPKMGSSRLVLATYVSSFLTAFLSLIKLLILQARVSSDALIASRCLE